jgi:hypothetical protein
VGGELSVPLAWRDLAAGPFSQVQWTERGAHYVVGAEVVYLLGALELGWFVHESRDVRLGFSGAALFGVGLGWIGPRVSIDSRGESRSRSISRSRLRCTCMAVTGFALRSRPRAAIASASKVGSQC